jgi:hypothetical protein
MKAIIYKQEVSAALVALMEAGKKTSLPALHAALGGRGSLSTIQKFKKEIEAEQEEQGSQVSEGALAMFRQVWTQAREEGQARMRSARNFAKLSMPLRRNPNGAPASWLPPNHGSRESRPSATTWLRN